MSTHSDPNYYRLQPFIIPTEGKGSIQYICIVMDLPVPNNDNNGNPMNYEHKASTVVQEGVSTILQIELIQPDSDIADLDTCTTYKAPIFFAQNDANGNPYTIDEIAVSVTLTNKDGEEIPVKSKVTPVKTSGLFEPSVANAESQELYAIRSAYLPTANTPQNLPYTLNSIGNFLMVFTKVASASEAPVMRKLYVIANGPTLFCTTIPLLDSNGQPPANYETKNVVAAHYMKVDSLGTYNDAVFEGFDSSYQIPSNTL